MAIRLRAVAREMAAAVLRYSGVPRAIRFANRRRATILVYHDPTPAVLEEHLAYLKGRFQFITLDALADALHSGDWTAIPRHALVITIDDGHRGNRLLSDVLTRYNVIPTIYLCSQIVGTNRAFWFLACDRSLVQRVKHLPNVDRLRLLEERCGYTPTRVYPTPVALSEDDLRELAPSVSYGAHTRFHPILTTCDAAECESEIRGAREDLEAGLGAKCRHFAYPNGDFSDREASMARRAGYATARSTDVGFNSPTTDPYRLRVSGVTDTASVNMLAVQVSGIVAYLRGVLRGNLDGRSPRHAS